MDVEAVRLIKENSHLFYNVSTKDPSRGSPDNSTSVLCVPRARRYAYDKIRDILFTCFTPKLGIEQMNKVPGKIEI